MTNIPENDVEFEEVTLKEVRHVEKGFELSRSDGWEFYIETTDFIPQIGQTARFYGKGIGFVVRGLSIDGRVVFYHSLEEEAERQAVLRVEYETKRKAALAESKIPDVITPGFEWLEGTREISGFGGAYERACRQMISQGCAWWAANPNIDPKFHGYKNVTGFCLEDNEDAKLLSKAVCGDIDPSGVMHKAAIYHVFRWKALGSWEIYQVEMQQVKTETGE